MNVSELIKELQKVKNQNVKVQLPQSDDFSEVYGLAECEEGTAIILCDKETFLAFSEG